MEKQTLTYSIAIRTLGNAGDKFRQELVSITKQTVQPERVLVYIAEGYARPDFTVGREEYVWVKKGMMAQRILPYDEIKSDCILMLDDDVCLAPDSAARLLQAMQEHNADCVGADTFKNQELSLKMKIYAAITNFVFPHWSKTWAFKIHRNGSFSYNNRPVKSFYLSQKCDGPAVLWRKSVFLNLHLADELWLDNLGFSYGDDTLISYKAYRNGYRLGVLYDSGVRHLDAGSSSEIYRKSPTRMFIRSKALFMIWWRSCYQTQTSFIGKAYTAAVFIWKMLWVFCIVCMASLVARQNLISLSLKGLREGWNFVHTIEYQSKNSYIIK